MTVTGEMEQDAKPVTKSIDAINDCLRHLTWVKSDLSSIRQAGTASINSPIGFSVNASKTFTFGLSPEPSRPHEQQTTFQNMNIGSNANTKRRIDIFTTPQFAAVARYVFAFSNPSRVLRHLWSIADGPFIVEDLEIVSNYIELLKLDSQLQS